MLSAVVVPVTRPGTAVAGVAMLGGRFTASTPPLSATSSIYQPALVVELFVASRQRMRSEWPAYFAVSVRLTTTCVKPLLVAVQQERGASGFLLPVLLNVLLYPPVANAAPEPLAATSNHAPPSTENSSTP